MTPPILQPTDAELVTRYLAKHPGAIKVKPAEKNLTSVAALIRRRQRKEKAKLR